jgi:hypothetical protein
MSVPRRRKDREPLNQVAGTPATVPPATADIWNRAARAPPPHDEFTRRAYQLFEARLRTRPQVGGLVPCGTNLTNTRRAVP